jgi:hypothetical protein
MVFMNVSNGSIADINKGPLSAYSVEKLLPAAFRRRSGGRRTLSRLLIVDLSDSERSIFLPDASQTMPTEFFNRIGQNRTFDYGKKWATI